MFLTHYAPRLSRHSARWWIYWPQCLPIISGCRRLALEPRRFLNRNLGWLFLFKQASVML